MTYALLLLLVTSLPLVLSPGPANLSLASFGVSFGFRRSLPYLLGVLAGTLGVLILVASGMMFIILAQPALTQVLKGLAMLYICYLAWTIATAPVVRNSFATDNPPSAWLGFGFALVNPKAFAAIGAIYMGHTIVRDDAFLDAAVKVLGISGAIAVSGLLWLSLGTIFSKPLQRPKLGRAVNVAFALLMVGSLGLAVSSI